MKKTTTVQLALCSLFSALIAVGAFVKIPIGMVPVTFQVLFAVMAGMLLGSKLGVSAVFTYIIIGLMGIPVFTQGGGIGYVLQPSFGYLIGFGVGAYVAGLIVEKSEKKNFCTYLIASGVFLVILYLVALPYLYCIVSFYAGKTLSVGKVLTSYCLVFLPNDIFSCILASFICKKLRPILI